MTVDDNERVWATICRVSHAIYTTAVGDNCGGGCHAKHRVVNPEVTAETALSALRPGDVLPGDGSGRLVVVREVADRPPVPTATPGRYAKCIDNNGSKIRLTIGKTYEVVEERLDAFGHFYRVLNDMNREEDFRAARFEPIAKEPPHD